MTPKAKELLVRMASAFDQNRKRDFDITFYMDVPSSDINELDLMGCIEKKNDIIGTIWLTRAGYEEAKK